MAQHAIQQGRESLHDTAAAYQDDAERPLGGYLVLMGSFVSMLVGFLLTARKLRKPIPDRFGYSDLFLVGVATHDLGRIVSKSGVTSPIRAPLTRYQGTFDPPAELPESVRSSGLKHVIGELVTCPFCLSLWIAALFSYGLVLAPRVTRLVASIFTIDAISDNLNLLYDATANVTVNAPEILEEKTSED